METAKESKDFATEQAPLLAQEMVAWAFWGSIIYAAPAVVLGIALLIASWRIHGSKMYADYWDRSSDPVPFPAFGYCVSVVAICWGLFIASDAVKAVVAPRLIVVQEVARLLPKGK